MSFGCGTGTALPKASKELAGAEQAHTSRLEKDLWPDVLPPRVTGADVNHLVPMGTGLQEP